MTDPIAILLEKARVSIEQQREALTIIGHELGQARDYIQRNQPRLDELTRQAAGLHIVAALLRGIIEKSTVEKLHEVENLVNLALNDIYPDRGVRFHFTIETKRDISTIIPHITAASGADGLTRTHGGGVLAPIALVLRILTNIFAHHLPLIVLDESLVHISSQYIAPTAQFLRDLTQELGITVVLVTHTSAFAEAAHQNILVDQNQFGSTTTIVTYPQ